MKLRSERSSIERLTEIREAYRSTIREQYEFRAKDCGECETPGACCLDAHFVNVRITRLEAAAIRKVIEGLPNEVRARVDDRVSAVIARVAEDETYACPLYEKGTGCLVHDEAKPIPCISHACYENAADLPPSSLQNEAEEQIDILNTLTYGKPQVRVAIPVAIRALNAAAGASPLTDCQ